MSDKKSWRDILDEFTDKIRSELQGTRGEKLKQQLRDVRDDIEEVLERDDAQRIKARLSELGEQTERAINRAVKSDAARDIIDDLEDVFEDIGDKIDDLIEPRSDSEEHPEEDPPA